VVEGEAPRTVAPVHLKSPIPPGPPRKWARVGLHSAALGERRTAPEWLADVRAAFGGAANHGGNGVPGRSVAVKEYGVLGYGVGGRRRARIIGKQRPG